MSTYNTKLTNLLNDLRIYFKEHYREPQSLILESCSFKAEKNYFDEKFDEEDIKNNECCSILLDKDVKPKPSLQKRKDLDELLGRKSTTFADQLNSLMLEKHLDSVTVYKRSNIDKKLFSKLNNRAYKPSKNTVLALLIGMKLNMQEAKELLGYAGFALSPSSKTDVIVSYFLEKEYADMNIDLVNAALYDYGEKTLGSRYE